MMPIDSLTRAQVLSVIGEVVTIREHDGEIVSFVLGLPMPYREMAALMLDRLFCGTLTDAHANICGDNIIAMMEKLARQGCDCHDLAAGSDGIVRIAQDRIDQMLSRRRASSPSALDALKEIIGQIEEQLQSIEAAPMTR